MLGTLGTITADSTPDSPQDWGCNDWVVWHKRLVEAYGQNQANEIWVNAWESQSFWDTQFNFCKYDCDWSTYFKSQGLDAGHLLSNIVCKGKDVSEDVLDSAGEITKGGITTAKVLKTAVPALLILLAAGVAYVGYNVVTGKSEVNIGPLKLGNKKKK